MNNNIFTTNFDGVEVRFVHVGNDVFVSRNDLVLCLKKCFTNDIQHLVDLIIDGGMQIVGDSFDRKSAILGDSAIGSVVHFHAAGNILSHLSGMRDVDNPSMRESSYRVNALTIWYAEAILRADHHFGRSANDLLGSVKTRLDRVSPPHKVDVYNESGIWTAVCDDLGLVTEAESFDLLTERVWEIAEDLIQENGVASDIGDVRLSFVLSPEHEDRVAL